MDQVTEGECLEGADKGGYLGRASKSAVPRGTQCAGTEGPLHG